MSISIFGLGYVGVVTAGCLTHQGFEVVGVDVHPHKVADFNQGKAPILEPEVDQYIQQASAHGRLRATEDAADAIDSTDISIVCVGTPSLSSGDLDLTAVRQVTQAIAEALRSQAKDHVLVYRSTMLPGSTRSLVKELLNDLVEAGRLKVFYYPEFLREGTAVRDFQDPSLMVVGTRNGEPPPSSLVKLFGVEAEVVPWETAEMVKYATNAFHATKITFANEIARLSKRLGVNSRVVMELLCEDTRLNISSCYLRPGNPFGGSCLPKDVRALNQYARKNDVPVPMIEHLLASNQRHLESLVRLIEDTDQEEVVILGLSFKVDTDDLRESAMVEVAQFLLGHGYRLRIYDPQLNLKQLVGTNKKMVENKLPHLASFLYRNLGSAIGQQGAIVAAQRCANLSELNKLVSSRHTIIDVNGWPELEELAGTYHGLGW